VDQDRVAIGLGTRQIFGCDVAVGPRDDLDERAENFAKPETIV
jgi:hypothetical protein